MPNEKGAVNINLAEQIRDMSRLFEAEAIAESLQIPLNLVESVISGDADDEALKNFDPSRNKETVLVEKKIITRGKVLLVVGNSSLAAGMAMRLAEDQIVAVMDVEIYPTLPIYLGLSISEIPQKVNIVWDNNIDNKKCGNLVVYQGKLSDVMAEICGTYSAVVINCSIDTWRQYATIADLVFVPQTADIAGLYTISQMFADNKYEDKSQIVWTDGDMPEPQCLNVIRKFTGIQVAGRYPGMNAMINPEKSKKLADKILQSVIPQGKRSEGGFFSRILKGAI